MSKEDIKKYQFTSQNQPSPEAKSRGWDRRATMRKIEKMHASDYLKLSRMKVVNKKMLDNICKFFDLDEDKITHSLALMGSVMIRAENGDTKALKILLDWIRESNQEEDKDWNVTIEHNVIE